MCGESCDEVSDVPCAGVCVGGYEVSVWRVAGDKYSGTLLTVIVTINPKATIAYQVICGIDESLDLRSSGIPFSAFAGFTA